MADFFPTAYEDEILYSIIARYHKKSGNTSITNTIIELYNIKKLTAIVDFPCNLKRLVSNIQMNWRQDIDELIFKNTLFDLTPQS